MVCHEREDNRVEDCDVSSKPSFALRTHYLDVIRIIAAHRVKNQRVFGSVLHGTDRDDSDLDLLVDALPGATLFDLGALQVDLQILLGVEVDVTTPGDLPESPRARVVAEAHTLDSWSPVEKK